LPRFVGDAGLEGISIVYLQNRNDNIRRRFGLSMQSLDGRGSDRDAGERSQSQCDVSAPPMVINGRVDGISRQARVDRFQSNTEGFDFMVLSPRGGGVGLTVTSANHVIHLSRWWNPAVEDQCTGKVHRIGQGRPVYVHVPIAKLPDGRASFDQNLHALLQRKLMKEALMPPAATEADRNDLWQATVA
jgi:hypothetical protein